MSTRELFLVIPHLIRNADGAAEVLARIDSESESCVYVDMQDLPALQESNRIRLESGVVFVELFFDLFG